MELITVRNSLIAVVLAAPLAPMALANDLPAPVRADVGTFDTVSEAQVGGILRVTNQVAQQLLQFAVTTSQNSRVKEFAEQALKDHQMAAKKADQVFDQIGVRSEDSPNSLGIQAEGVRDYAALQIAAQAGNFDKTFIDMEVRRHQDELNRIDSLLLPSAENQNLKDFLTQMRGEVQKHLTEAQNIQVTIGS